MSVTIANITTNFQTYLGDSSEDRITAVQRREFFTEATAWMQELAPNDHGVDTYDVDYYDTLNYYKITTAVADFFEGNDLRKKVGEQLEPFTRKSSTEIADEITNGVEGNSWTIERRDGDTFLVINQHVKYSAIMIARFDSLTEGNGTWTADETGSDALNVTLDDTKFTEGSGAINFDVDVSQSSNHLGTIYNPALSNLDFSTLDSTGFTTLSSLLLDIDLPDADEISSVTITFSSDTASTPSSINNYIVGTTTTDVSGNALVAGENTVKINWKDMTTTGTLDFSAIVYCQININYTSSQADDTDFRVDNLRLVRPEKLKLYYQSYKVGVDNAGADITAFAAETDVPYFSGRYDQYKYALARKSAALAFESLGMYTSAQIQEGKAIEVVQRISKTIPTSLRREQKTFKVRGINFNK